MGIDEFVTRAREALASGEPHRAIGPLRWAFRRYSPSADASELVALVEILGAVADTLKSSRFL